MLLMKKFLCFAGVLAFAMCAVSAGGKIRVACVGDSITYGAGINDRSMTYPAQLGRALGDKYEVVNFGVSGTTALRKGNSPYFNCRQFKPSHEFNPNIVIIKLGTNDCKSFNWRFSSEFETDLNELIDSYAALPSKPKIYLCLPATVYQEKWGINEPVVVNGVIPAVKKVAKERGLEVIDLHAATAGKPQMFPDGVHPNAEGAAVMVAEILKHIGG